MARRGPPGPARPRPPRTTSPGRDWWWPPSPSRRCCSPRSRASPPIWCARGSRRSTAWRGASANGSWPRCARGWTVLVRCRPWPPRSTCTPRPSATGSSSCASSSGRAWRIPRRASSSRWPFAPRTPFAIDVRHAPSRHGGRGHAGHGRRRSRRRPRRRRPRARRPRHHRRRRRPRSLPGRAARRRAQLRRLDRRRRRGDGGGAGHRHQRRRRGPRRGRRRRGRRARRPRLHRLRLSRRRGRAVRRDGADRAAQRIRALEAGRRAGRSGRCARRPRDRPLGLDLRPARQELRRHHAAARRRAPGAHRGRRPDRLPHLHRPPRRRARDGRRAPPAGRDARRGRRRLLVVGPRAGDIRPRRPRRHRPPRTHGRPRPPRPAPRLLRARLHPLRRAGPGALAGGPRRPSRGPGGPRVKLLVCGGAGFIGSNFVRIRVRDHGDEVVVLDKLTYAGRRENLHDLEAVKLVVGGIEDPERVAEAAEGADAVVNFAAETHVDRSIAEPEAFINTHGMGTYVLLEAARERSLRYVQVSTDEVYGSIETGSFTETSPLNPSSPYSATKAGADLLVSSYHHTYGLETLICRGSNNYGPYQYPEKLIPLMVLNALHGDALPVYGDGMQVRNWLFVEDFARGIGRVLESGVPGEAYNVGGPDECANIDVVRRIVELTDAAEDLIEHVPDRPGHDRRYSLSSDKTRGLGWEPQVRFAEGIARTVAWYRDNASWWEPIRSGEYRAYYERQYGRALG